MLVFISELLSHFDSFLGFCLFVFVFTFHFCRLGLVLEIMELNPLTVPRARGS